MKLKGTRADTHSIRINDQEMTDGPEGRVQPRFPTGRDAEGPLASPGTRCPPGDDRPGTQPA